MLQIADEMVGKISMVASATLRSGTFTVTVVRTALEQLFPVADSSATLSTQAPQ